MAGRQFCNKNSAIDMSYTGRLLIRADANHRMGTGHLMRCLGLAQAWRERGGSSTFLTACDNDYLNERIKAAGSELVPLDAAHPEPEDLATSLSLLGRLEDPWVVIDGYHFDPGYQEAVRSAGYRSLVVDDFAHLPEYHADVLLNQNIQADSLTYRVDPDTRMLLGTRYTILRQEFEVWRGSQRPISDLGRKVLVVMGGSDPDNVTLKVLNALQEVEKVDFESRIVLGPASAHLESLIQEAQTPSAKIQVFKNVTDMPGLMAWADIAVSAGGSSIWELAFMGVPTIGISRAAQELKLLECVKSGIVVNLGDFRELEPPTIGQALVDLALDKEKRTMMSTKGKNIVDGLGAARILDSFE
jgi:UDP-2,4-diacetamido-2,4,6-trideoxy-beta-L-altropyranose hydrolase